MGLRVIVRAVDWLVRAVRVLAGLTLVAGVALNFANIVGRYFLDAPIEWAEEVMLFLMVGIVFLGAVAVSWEGRHIRMDIVVDLLPPRPRLALKRLASLAEIAVALVIAWLGVPVIAQLATFDERSQAANFPLFIPQALVPLALVLIALVTLTRLLAGRSKAPDAGAGGGHAN